MGSSIEEEEVVAEVDVEAAGLVAGGSRSRAEQRCLLEVRTMIRMGRAARAGQQSGIHGGIEARRGMPEVDMEALTAEEVIHQAEEVQRRIVILQEPEMEGRREAKCQ